MSITVNPELEARLKARAGAEGVSVAEYLESLLKEEDQAIAHTDALLREASESGDYIDLNKAEWNEIQREAGLPPR